MKWYAHDPSAALAGMIGLTVEERGAYYTLMDLQYARAPHGDVTDELISKALGVRPQVWRRLKGSLIAKGKVHETDGKLTANRVETELKLAANRMDKGVVSEATSAKTNGLDGIRARATTTTTTTVVEEEEEKPSKGFSSSSSEDRAPPAGDASLANGSRRPNGGSPDPNDRLLSDDEIRAMPFEQRKAYYRKLQQAPAPPENIQ